MNNRDLDMLASANRQARDNLTEEIYRDLWKQVRILTKDYAKQAKAWFPDGKWGAEYARQTGLMPHVNQATRELTGQISALIRDAAIEVRRRCYLRGIKAAQVNQEIVGEKPAESLDVVFQPRKESINGRRVSVLGYVVSGKTITVLRESETVLPNLTTIDEEIQGKDLDRVLAIIATIPLAIRAIPKHIVLADLGAIHGEWEDGTIKLNPSVFRSKRKFGTHDKIDQLTHALVHEFMHAWGQTTGLDTDKEWLGLSGWQLSPTAATPEGTERYVEKRKGWPKEPTEWVHAKDAWFTRSYGGKSPEEDFADCARDLMVGWDDSFNGGGEAKRNWIRSKLAAVSRAVKREASAPADTNIRARVLIPDGDGVWAIGDPPMLPGGGVKRGEGLRSAAVREALEETGLQVEIHGKCLCAVPQDEMTVCYFVGKRTGGKPTSLDHDGHTPVNPRIVPFDELTTEQDKAAVAAYLKRT